MTSGPELVPYDRAGHMAAYAAAGCDMRPNEPFVAELHVVDVERGRSAARFVLRDPETGVKYPMFLSDLFAILREHTIARGKIAGRWRAHKRGQNYGLYLIEPEETRP